jgi:hypothetical protein
MKITSKLANKIFSKQNKIQIFILTTTSFEYFNHEQIFSVCSAFTQYSYYYKSVSITTKNNSIHGMIWLPGDEHNPKSVQNGHNR